MLGRAYGDHFEREAVAGVITVEYRAELVRVLGKIDATLDHVRRAIVAEASKGDPDRSFLGYLYERVDDLQARRDTLTVHVEIRSLGISFSNAGLSLQRFLRGIYNALRNLTRKLLDLVRDRLPGLLRPRPTPAFYPAKNPSRSDLFLLARLDAALKKQELAARNLRNARAEAYLRRRPR